MGAAVTVAVALDVGMGSGITLAVAVELASGVGVVPIHASSALFFDAGCEVCAPV